MAKKKVPALEDVYRSREAKKFQKNPNFGENPPTANMDEIVVAKAVDELEASGGDCPVIIVYDKDERIGSLVHVSAEHAQDAYHAALLDHLLAAFDISPQSRVFVAMDLTGPGKEEAERTGWLDQIVSDLEERGFANIETCTNAEGKYVSLDATEGRLVVRDHNENELLDVDLTAN